MSDETNPDPKPITVGHLKKAIETSNLDDDAAVLVESFDDRNDVWEWLDCSRFSIEITADGPVVLKFHIS